MLDRARKRSCTASNAGGSPCGFSPMGGEPFCFWHHPDYEAEAAEARRLGGRRRRREKAIEGAYDLPESLDSTGGISRLLDITTKDLLGMKPSIARTNALLRVVREARELMETGNLAQDLADVKAAVAAGDLDSSFDDDLPKVELPLEPSRQ